MKKTSEALSPYSAFDLNNADVRWVENTLNHMTLYEKCAQMVMPWVEAEFMNEDDPKYKRLVHLVRDLKVGGLIFFEGDVINQVMLTNKLQRLSGLPLLISADYERGVGMRLKDAVEFPYNMAVAAADDTALTYMMGKIIGQETRAIGVQQNYAPMVDINNHARNPIINIRSYSEDKDIIDRHMLAFMKGMEEENVLTTAKHFPGHGATDLDSHRDLPLLSQSRKSFETNDLVPFEKAISAGVKSVMVGHLEVPAYEPKRGLPATLSRNIITKLLKDQLGFNGLIVTDAMNMHGLTKHFKSGPAALKAVQAGNDIILFPPDESKAISAIYNAVESGKLKESRIDYSVRKILAAKKWLHLDNNRYVDIDSVSRSLNSKSHIRLAQDIADKSITLVKNTASLVPVNPANYSSVACITLSDLSAPAPYYFEKLVKERFNNVRHVSLGKTSTGREFNEAMEAVRSSDLVLVPIFVKVKAFTGSIGMPEEEIKLVKALSELKKPVIFMSMGNPYILSNFPEAPNYLCSYGDPKVSQIAMMKAITGEVDITGKLPISIPDTPYKVGDGIRMESQTLKDIQAESDSSFDFSKVDEVMNSGLSDSVFPGAVAYVGYKGKVIYKKAFGHYTYGPGVQPMETDAMFDLASVSKVIGTTTAAMLLYDEGKLILDKKVSDYLPDFANHGKENITIRNLLLHNAGFPADKPFYKMYKNHDQVAQDIMNTSLEYPTGTKFLYSDLSMITLQLVIEKIAGMPLDRFLKKRVFEPLGMSHTMYNPPKSLWNKCVPTEVDNYWRMDTVRGTVHDENAAAMGGVAGHAGLFSTAGDLSTFMQMMLNKGRYDGKQLIKPSTVELFTSKVSEQSSRGLGWDTKAPTGSSAGSLFSTESFGHTGFTGTSVWADKTRNLFVVLLTNRVFPTRKNNKIIKFRPLFHDAVIRAISY
ncbi:MAG: serine hydrolase [Ignavibacteria bacterium]|jgi:beta-glucosidase-like glycosyl hydrolase/CubicO group peptidase (beta-lactamase class C family)|nr:serine hydrolase [Ignavibacteria bacterium]MCU7504230.1 serine hydrolase [Ignavibacteria bacterium]MCU7516075.1 serine hydrolase [Ignavibacteria bacterium]